MSPLPKNKMRLIGRREFVDFPLLGIKHVEAKIDTGAYTASFHCETIMVHKDGEQSVLYFTINPTQKEPYVFKEFTQKKVKNSFGEMEERYVIKTMIAFGGKKIWSTISLTNRDNMRYPVLIGRRLLKGKFLIDANQIHTNGMKLKSIITKKNK